MTEMAKGSVTHQRLIALLSLELLNSSILSYLSTFLLYIQFVGMGMKDADNKADMFYSVMFLYYSLYDGAEEKGQIKDRFENVIDDIALKLNN